MKMGLGLGLQKRGGTSTSGPAVTALVATATGGTTAQLDITASAGTVYWYISTSATRPSVANIKDGTGATSFGNYTHPGTFTGPSGLTASTTYYPYALVNDGVSDSEIYAGASFATEAADVTAPNLTLPDATVLDTTSADMIVTTNEGRGTLWAIASTVNSAPSAAQIKLGQDGSGTTTNVAFAAGGGTGVNVSATGVQTITATGLSEVAHYGFFYQEDPTGNESSVVPTGAFTPADVTGPVITSFDLSLSTDPGFAGSFNTDTADGALDVVLAYPSNAPTATKIKNGQDHLGATAAGRIAAQAVSATGPQAISGTATANGTWRGYAVHTDAAGNVSDVLASDATVVIAGVSASWSPSDETLLAWMDSSDTSTTFQDTTANTAAGIGDPVRRINDKTNGQNYQSSADDRRPILTAGGLDFDGSNDALSGSANLDLTAYDQISLFIVIEADADGATQMVIEHGAPSPPTFRIFRDSTNDYVAAATGSASINANQSARTSSTYAAVSLSAIVATYDIPLSQNSIYVDNTGPDQSSGSMGTGNFGSLVLQIGSRTNSSLRFNGRIAEFAIFAGIADATLRSNIDAYVTSKWGTP